MIYFVTGYKELYPPDSYKYISIEESLKILETLSIVSLDTETTGLNVFKGKLLTLQLGNKDIQIVIDCLTVDIHNYKSYLESHRLFIIHNAKFDLKWLYKEGIIIRNVYDTFLAEKILYLGYPPGIISCSLQDSLKRHLNIYLDKSIRGEINSYGLTEDVIIYAANDVVYLEDLMVSQLKIIEERNQKIALDIENEFVKVLTYIEFCGIKLDPVKWKNKMIKDKKRLEEAEEALNKWVLEYVFSKEDPYVYITDREVKKGEVNKFIMIPPNSLFEEFNTGPICIINWNSSKQVIELFEDLGFNLLVKDKKTGKLKKSVGANIIKNQEDKSSIVPLYLEYSAAFKVVSSFGQNFLDAIEPSTQRIHPTFNQLMRTGRISCGSGGKGNSDNEDEEDLFNNSTNSKSVNIQQLPGDEETRACFIAEENNLLIDCDYGDQEGKIFAELADDKEWILFYNDPNERDGHSFVAKMCFPKELEGIEESEVKKKRKDLRALAKSARFCFNYNGQSDTMAANCNIDKELAKNIYDNYFKRFNGIANYFKYKKKFTWDNGYILISRLTGLRSYIYDHDILRGIDNRKNNTPNFWDIYRNAKNSGNIISEIPTSVIHEIVEKFSKNFNVSDIAKRYEYHVKKANKIEKRYIDINEETVYITALKYLFKRKSSIDNDSCNYSSQGTAAEMTKIAAVKYFNYLIKNNLVFKVLIPNIVHDELLIESPKDIAERESKKLSEYMEYSASIFCKKVFINAVPEIESFWKH